MNFFLYPALFAVPAFAAEGLSKGDRDFMLSHLHGARKLTLDAVAGLTEAQWKFKPAADRWSIAEVIEHLILAERGLFRMTEKIVKGAPVAVLPEGKPADETVLKNAGTRDPGTKSPPMFEPKGAFRVGEPLTAEYRAARDATIGFVRETTLDLRHLVGKGPGGPMDSVQWILFISAHNDRHLGQIAEIKASAGYPN
jgi:hypothetical protein